MSPDAAITAGRYQITQAGQGRGLALPCLVFVDHHIFHFRRPAFPIRSWPAALVFLSACTHASDEERCISVVERTLHAVESR
jgi:hypothetical protein